MSVVVAVNSGFLSEAVRDRRKPLHHGLDLELVRQLVQVQERVPHGHRVGHHRCPQPHDAVHTYRYLELKLPVVIIIIVIVIDSYIASTTTTTYVKVKM